MGKRYTQEFKDEAVRLVREEQRPIKRVAEELGSSRYALRQWVKAVPPAGARSASLEQEHQRLRKELRVVQMERDILKKATAFFAKESR